MNKQEATETISDNLDKIYTLLKECESLADEHKVMFEFSGGGYGMGGSYLGERTSYADAGWNASSQSC